MKNILFLFCFLVLFFGSLKGQVVGAGGRCHVLGDPNSIASIRVIDARYYCSSVLDTLTGNVYDYDINRAVGSRWVRFSGNENNTVRFNANQKPEQTNVIRVLQNGDVRINTELGRAKLNINNSYSRQHFLESSTEYKSLACFYSLSVVSGAIIIDFPRSPFSVIQNTFFKIKISGASETGPGGWDCIVKGYIFQNDFFWFGTTISGDANFNRVRMGKKNDRLCLVIGETTNVWSYPYLFIEKFEASQADDNYGSDWGISINQNINNISLTDSPVSKSTYINLYNKSSKILDNRNVWGDNKTLTFSNTPVFQVDTFDFLRLMSRNLSNKSEYIQGPDSTLISRELFGDSASISINSLGATIKGADDDFGNAYPLQVLGGYKSIGYGKLQKWGMRNGQRGFLTLENDNSANAQPFNFTVNGTRPSLSSTATTSTPGLFSSIQLQGNQPIIHLSGTVRKNSTITTTTNEFITEGYGIVFVASPTSTVTLPHIPNGSFDPSSSVFDPVNTMPHGTEIIICNTTDAAINVTTSNTTLCKIRGVNTTTVSAYSKKVFIFGGLVSNGAFFNWYTDQL